MSPTYFTDLRSALTVGVEDEWWGRTNKSAKHILTAVCFRETAYSVSKKTGNVLFSPIGFYYALFHMGVAVLSMDYLTKTQELRRLRHRHLQTLLEQRLVNSKLLDRSYLELLRELQELREYANYVFGERVAKYEYKIMASELYTRTGDQFDIALKFILQVENIICKELRFSAPIQVAIGDGFGDDLKRAYLSSSDEEKVNEYLLEKSLST